MKKSRLALLIVPFVCWGCGGRGPVLSTPKNQAGTRSVVLPGYTQAPPSAERLIQADAAAVPAVTAEAALMAALAAVPEVTAAEPPPEPEPVQKRADPGKIDLEIREKMFIAQTNDVYLNPEDYMGKTIKLEGLFKIDQYVGAEKEYCFVLRYGPGCCGNDGSAGFEVAWGRPQPYAGPETVKTLPSGPAYPAVDAWVEVVGVLDTYEEDGYPYIYLDLVSLTEKEDRGADFVTQ
ncbi:MAG: hypothetical protein LBE14_00810 [Treponema sp.]|jgi:hypothetical protein|nr:hypothetical protein [Treponema sp.]